MSNDWIHQTARAFAVELVAESELMLEGVPVLIPVEEIIHTDERPFCSDPDCPCQVYDKRVAPDLELPARLVSGMQACAGCGKVGDDVEDGMCETCWQKVLDAIE